MHHNDYSAHHDMVQTARQNKYTIQKMPKKTKPQRSHAPGLFLVLLMLSCGSAMGAF
jgi:hypothetical protein